MKKSFSFTLLLVFALILVVLLTSKPVQALIPSATATFTPTFTPPPATATFTPTFTPPPATATFTPTLIYTATAIPSTAMPVITSTPETQAPIQSEKDNGPAQGDWQVAEAQLSSKVISVGNLYPSTPNDWSIALSDGIQIGGSTQICHPFLGGQFGWQSSIYLLNGKSWIEIPTTVEWYPDEEGQLMACAFAPVSGTYAMFGFWE